MLNKMILTALLKPTEQEKMAGRKQLEAYLIISDRDEGVTRSGSGKDSGKSIEFYVYFEGTTDRLF